MLVPNSAAMALQGVQSGERAMPEIETPDGLEIHGPHPEWLEHVITWRWLLDSYEGGQAYRQAVYGYDTRRMPIRNLRRHKFEYPAAGSDTYGAPGPPVNADAATAANDDTYELRRSRTPVPTFTGEVIEIHLSKIAKHEVDRDAPDAITAWWKDVDGKGTCIDDFMAEIIAPIFLTLGQLDVIVDLPAVPEGETLTSRADEIRMGLDTPVLSYILPDNLVWWELDRLGYYERCLIRETGDDGCCRWRYWTKESWCLFGEEGEPLGPPTPHPYGRVPICRVFDRRRARCRNIGQSRYEETADLQREYYNRDSELILSDTLQAHPIVMAPEDYITNEGEIKTGPDYILPKKLVHSGAQAFYESWEVLDFPKGASESIRQNKHDIRDAVDRANALTKPAGARGTGGSTVSQSGVSKQMDQTAGNDLLAKIAKSLEKVENEIAELYHLVSGKGDLDLKALDTTTIQYPTEFDLMSPLDLAECIDRVQLMLGSAGVAPEIEQTLFSRLIKSVIPGLEDDQYEAMDKELETVIADAAKARKGGTDLNLEGGPLVIAGNKGWPGVAVPPPTQNNPQGSIDGGQGPGPAAGASHG